MDARQSPRSEPAQSTTITGPAPGAAVWSGLLLIALVAIPIAVASYPALSGGFLATLGLVSAAWRSH